MTRHPLPLLDSIRGRAPFLGGRGMSRSTGGGMVFSCYFSFSLPDTKFERELYDLDTRILAIAGSYLGTGPLDGILVIQTAGKEY